jgi:hypothetical protein
LILRKVLATDLGIWPVLQNLPEVSDAMLASNEVKRALANYILLYDQIFIPTGNLQILPVLRILLGEDIFDELVKNNVLVLARYDKWLWYAGNGGGLSCFSMTNEEERHKFNLFFSYFKNLDECIDTALRTTTPIASANRSKALTNLLLDKVTPVTSNIKSETFKDETYKDISGSPYFRKFLNIRNNGRSLDKLKGIKPNQIRIYSPHTKEDNSEIGAVLHAAFENFVLGIGSDLKVDEITGDDYSLSLLKAKGQRVGMPIEGQKAFAQIQEISGVPDVGLAFANNQITAEQLLDLRELKSAENFRKWLNTTHQPQNSHEDIVNAFVESLGQTGFADSYLMKTLRLVTTTAIGLSNGSAGVAACWADTFWLNKLFPDKSPRLFLKQIKSVVVKSTDKEKVMSEPPKQSGRDRNRPCSCGSGEKYKKCCGS